MRWLPEQNAWGCDRCRKLVSPSGSSSAPQARKRSGKGLVIGLGAGVVIAGVVIVVVVATGGGAGAGARDELVKSVFAAVQAGDVDKLLKLMDMEALVAAALDCGDHDAKSGKDNQAREDKKARALEKFEKETRGRLAELLATTKGLKLELVAFDTAKKRKGPDEGEPDVDVKKPGESFGEGLTAYLSVADVDGAWFLLDPPIVRVKTARFEQKLREFRTEACACKDTSCADRVSIAAAAWRRSEYDAIEALSEDERVALGVYDEEIRSCEDKVMLAKLAEFKDRACACSDQACFSQVEKDKKDWEAAHPSRPLQLSNRDAKQLFDIDDQMSACRTRVHGGADSTR